MSHGIAIWPRPRLAAGRSWRSRLSSVHPLFTTLTLSMLAGIRKSEAPFFGDNERYV
jgi:hypothetical protein